MNNLSIDSELAILAFWGWKKVAKKSWKKLRKNLQVKKKGVPLQSLSETGVRQQPQGRVKIPPERSQSLILRHTWGFLIRFLDGCAKSDWRGRELPFGNDRLMKEAWQSRRWKDAERSSLKRLRGRNLQAQSTRVGAKQGVQEQVPKNNKNESVNSVFQIGKTLRN